MTGTQLRILHVIASDRFAGVEQFVRRLAIAQAGTGHAVFVGGGAVSQMRDELAAAGVRHAPAVSALDVARIVRASVGRVDVVNSHMTAADVGASLSLGLRAHGPALVATRHFTAVRGTRGPRLAYRMLERRIDAEIAISEAVARTAGSTTIVVPSGIDLPARSPGARSGRTVLMAQRLQPEKDTDTGLRAFAASGLPSAGWALQIAGDGAERAALERLADELAIADHVDFLGFRDDVPQLMSRADLLLAPCGREGFGLTVLEAMTSALPVVAAAAGGHLELLAPVAADVLFPPGDVEAAAARLRALALDHALRRRIGDIIERTSRDSYSASAQVTGTDAVYRSAIARRAAGR